MSKPAAIKWSALLGALKRIVFGVSIGVLSGALLPACAETPTDQVSVWDALNQRAINAYQAGDLDEAVSVGEQALALSKAAFGPHDFRTLRSMNNLAAALVGRVRYAEAEPLLRDALQLRREALAPDDPAILTSIRNLASVLTEEGRYGEAENLDREALQLSRETLGPRDPRTLANMNNLATALAHEGRYGEAESLYRDTLQLSRVVLGTSHPDTLNGLSNLATVLAEEGHYGEAETLDREALRVSRETLGPRDPHTLTVVTSLAAVLEDQGRESAAEPLLREAVQSAREVLGVRHPNTLANMNNLAAVLESQGRYAEAEPLYGETLRLRREALGPRHPDTLISLNNLAEVFWKQGRYREAEPLLRECLQLDREVLGSRHLSTLATVNNLGTVLRSEGRYGEAEPLIREAVDISRDLLGPSHPTTSQTQFNLVSNLAAQGRIDEAAALQRQMEPQVLAWLGVELYSTEAASVRQRLVTSQSDYQDVALSLALLSNAGVSSGELAASVLLRFKSLAVEEEAYLARLERLSSDPRIRTVATEIAQLHQRLAKLFLSDPSGQQVKDLTSQLDNKELELGRISRDYAPYLQVKNSSLQDLRASLPPKSALLELRLYRPLDFRLEGRWGGWRWAGVLIPSEGDIEVHDLGASGDTATQVQAILTKGASAEAATAALSDQMLTPFAPSIAKLRGLYVAPDGVLALLPFGLLHDATGHRLMDSLDLRTVQTGRDLLRPPPEHAAKGLVAVGGIDFGAIEPRPEPAEGQTPVAEVQPAAVDPTDTGSMDALPLTRTRAATADTFRNGFPTLAFSKLEVEAIASQYRIWRHDEPVSIVEGDKPTKEWLMALSPPRVLHLATHGFYREPKAPADQPMLLAGVALAGANQSLKRQDASGILYALEAEDLNLEGTELVVLSACDTAFGQIDYGEGLSGLIRALRTAGARNVLVTLGPVDDQGAERFMERFYYYWFKQEHSDPAAALRDAQREASRDSDSTWTNFVMIGSSND